MGLSNVRADTTGKRRAFGLPTFRKLNGEQRRRQSAAATAHSEEARKAAAWQWHSREVAEAVAPTKASPAAGNGGRRIPSGTRFKAEAIANAQPKNPFPKPLPALLRDEADLSRLKYHISSFLQQQDSMQSDGRKLACDGRKLATIKGHCIPADRSIAHSSCRPPAAEKQVCISTSTAPIPQSCRLSSIFSAPVSAFHSLYRKILSRPSQPSSQSFPSAKPTSVDQESEAGNIKYHYHSYIHHHHHHYHHFGTAISNPADEDNYPRIRRFSESAYNRGCSSSSVYDSSDEMDSEDEETASPDSPFSARLRRHSCSSFSEKHKFAETISDIVAIKLERKIAMENAQKDQQRLPSRHSLERYSREALEGILQDKLRPKREEGKGLRRRSMDSMREGECMRHCIDSRPLP